MNRIPMQGRAVRIALALLILFTFITPLAAQQPVTLRLRAAIIDENMTVRPVPQTAFLAVGARGDTTRLETDLDGLAEAKLTAGQYRIISSAPVRMNGLSYTWSVDVHVATGMRTIELTQRNALTEKSASAPSAAVGGRRVSDEARIYEALKSGVFTIAGAGGRGSGFLVDRAGIVLTNAHVVRDVEPDQVRIIVNGETAVRGRLLVLDRDRDVAAIAIHPDVCAECAVLPLAETAADGVAVEGERVLAIGSPLNQRGILTIGIVSKVEPRALISDVNINHGNSGGPMLNLDGRVIAINTFGDFTDKGGPGVSGSILITQAKEALAAARDSLTRSEWEAPSPKRLPVLGKTPFPLEGVKVAADMDKMNLKPYVFSGGPFDLQVMTPPVIAFRQSQALKELSGRRKKREEKAGVTDNEKVDNIQAWYAWDEYVGNRSAAVIVQVVPKIGQTGGSLFANILGAALAGYTGTYYTPHSTYEFKGDFRRMKLLRDGIAVEAVEENRVPAVLNIQDYYNSGKDIAFQGVYVYRPEDFAPRDDGTMPRMQFMITNTGKPKEPVFVDLEVKTVTTVHHDFASWRLALEAPACGEDPNGQACAVAMSKAAAASGLVLVNDADIYNGPSAWGKILGKAKKGTPVVVVRSDGKWTFVRAGEYSGYVEAKFVGSAAPTSK